jgi:hypothetical protein
MCVYLGVSENEKLSHSTSISNHYRILMVKFCVVDCIDVDLMKKIIFIDENDEKEIWQKKIKI